MLKTFRLSGYAVNQRGNTVGIHFSVNAANNISAMAQAKQQATQEGYSYIRINYVSQGVNHA